MSWATFHKDADLVPVLHGGIGAPVTALGCRATPSAQFGTHDRYDAAAQEPCTERCRRRGGGMYLSFQRGRLAEAAPPPHGALRTIRPAAGAARFVVYCVFVAGDGDRPAVPHSDNAFASAMPRPPTGDLHRPQKHALAARSSRHRRARACSATPPGPLLCARRSGRPAQRVGVGLLINTLQSILSTSLGTGRPDAGCDERPTAAPSPPICRFAACAAMPQNPTCIIGLFCQLSRRRA